MVDNQLFITQNAKETSNLGEKIGDSIAQTWREGSTALVALYGPLGSGKTTFVQGFARSLNIVSRLLSPTYLIVRRYPLALQYKYLYHIDLYRLAAHSEVGALGLSEILSEPNSIVVIEWAERIEKMLPGRRFDIQFSLDKDGSHKINVQILGNI